MIEHKNCFKDLGLPSKGPPEGKIMVFYKKKCHKNSIPFKNHKICRKFGKSVLGY